MKTNSATCVLCGHPAEESSTDHGNRTYVACSSATCGDYEISNSAARKLAESPERKSVLSEMAARANCEGKILDISIATDGLMQATSIKRD